jgi:hypothetical protein
MVAAATAIPLVTAGEIVMHASAAARLVALGPAPVSGPASGAPMSAPAAGSAPPQSGGNAATATPSGSAGSATIPPQPGAPSISSPQSYAGPAVQNPFGTVQATLVVTGNKITDVIISAPQDNPRSAYINAYAVPILRSETLQAQNANVNAVSGATYTSEAFIGSLQAALVAAHL